MLTDTINHFRASEKETQFVASLKDTIKRFSRPPASMHPNVKYLTIMACHTDSILRINTIVNNLKYLRFKNNDIIIINSKNTKHGNNLKTICNNMSIQYIEILNDTALDSGKWMHVLKHNSIHPYKYVVFTNDSFYINNPVCHFYNLMMTRNVDLYGYNDSTQITYHYQSYLFGIKRESVHKFITHYESVRHLLTDYLSVVSNIELKLTSIFQSKDCFLKIGNFYKHKDKNIFFNSDSLYIKLMQNQLLPFVKLKRLIADRNVKNKPNISNQLHLNIK
jgi:hypothetical protein